MLQDEVARRVASPPGSKEYGLLSVLVGLWADIDIPLRFPAGAFVPPPKVASALLRIRFRPEPKADAGPRVAFERLVGAAFSKRRKTLENNLQVIYPNLKDHLRLLNLTGSRRAETLSVVEFAHLAKSLGA
jgi:16S rRNA (adenine1518-N6/adenine1519-N6)-dimethyltransferase